MIGKNGLHAHDRSKTQMRRARDKSCLRISLAHHLLRKQLDRNPRMLDVVTSSRIQALHVQRKLYGRLPQPIDSGYSAIIDELILNDMEDGTVQGNSD